MAEKNSDGQWMGHDPDNERNAATMDATPGDSAKKRRASLELNPEDWFAYYFPDYASAVPASFHKAATQRIMEHPEWYEVRCWSRELAKSTRTMLEVLYLTLAGYPKKSNHQKSTRKRNVLLISNSLENACRLLLPYRLSLESNKRLIEDYGKQMKYGSWTEEEFVTTRGVSYRAVGTGQSPRGTRNEAFRPDVILFDDVDTDEDCRNPETIKHNWQWIQEAVIPTRSVSNPLLIIFCGNVIAKDCCVLRAQEYADHTDIINIRDEAGRSTWPEKNTEADIDRVLSLISFASVHKEYYNNPLQEGSVFNEVYYKPALPLAQYSLLVCYTDPSYKESRNNDYKATVLCGKWQSEFHVLKAYVFQGTTARMIDAHYEIMDYVQGHNCYYYIEQVFLQELFLKEFYEAGAAKGKTVPIMGDQRQKPDKYMRIESLLEPLNRNGKLYLNEYEKNSPGMKVLEQQLLAFAPGSRCHDDGPDALEGAVWILNNKTGTHTSPLVTQIVRTRPSSKYF